jgi:hypothetical protein
MSFLTAALAVGCAGETTVGYRTNGYVEASTPDLAPVGGGVSVIADYDEPIFYSNGYYWWNYDGGWYRSNYYTGGWAYVDRPPTAVINIRAPLAYRHYRPHGYVVRNRPVPSHRLTRPTVAHRGRVIRR